METTTSNKQAAIVLVAGAQHLVYQGQKIVVNRLVDEVGATLTIPSMLDKTPVTLKVISHGLGTKINGLKFKNKVRYIRHYGHRQHQTTLEVTAVGVTAPSAPAKAEKAKAIPAAKTTTAKKPAVRKATPKARKEVKNG
jgi:large subunit ribosomal protein L21